jgi:hypothetical protein
MRRPEAKGRQLALVHAARVSFYSAALVDEMLGQEGRPRFQVLDDQLLRLDDIIHEAEAARAEVRAIRGSDQVWDSLGP